MTRLELMGRKTEEVVPALLKWWGNAMGTRQEDEHVWFEALSVLEAHDTPATSWFRMLSMAKSRDLRAYTAPVIGRWIKNGSDDLDLVDEYWRLSRDNDSRVRCAAILAAGNISPTWLLDALSLAGFDPEGVLDPTKRPRESDPESIANKRRSNGDKFLMLAVRAATDLFRPSVGTDPEWKRILSQLQSPPGSPKSAPSAKSADNISATVPATGKLRATPEFVAALVKEVRESGDAKHGGEVFRRAELACTACHSIADQGGKIGPPLDTIGSGQPVDFIIGATLEPQREIKESYEALQLTAKDGRTALGYVAARDPQQTTLRDPATGTETKFATGDIKEQKQLGSFMPAALVDNLSREDLRDLFRYLSELGKPVGK
jgi:putative heme-binding domain-containing protein